MFRGRVALFAYSVAVLFFRLGSRSITDADEVRYALTSRAMAVTGNWWTPHFDGAPIFSKPPLFFWLTGAALKIFGPSEWTIRVLPAFAGIACVFLLAALGARLYGEAAGLGAGFILATTIPFLYEHGARTGVMDSLLLALLCASFLFVLKSGEKSGWWLLAAALAMGLASLTKNLMGMAAAAAAAVFLVRKGRWRKYTPAQIAAAVILLLALSFGWIAGMAIAHPHDFEVVFFRKEMLERALEPAKFSRGRHGGGFFRRSVAFAESSFRGFVPWCFLVPLACWQAFRRNREERLADELPTLWLAVMGLAVLTVQSRFPWYAFLVDVPLALLLGRVLAVSFAEGVLPVLPGAALSSVVVGFLFFVPNLRYSPVERDSMQSTVATVFVSPRLGMSFAAAIAAVAAIAVLFPRWPRPLLRAARGAVLLAAAVFAAAPLRTAGFRWPFDDFLRSLRAADRSPGARLVLWRPPPATFLLDHDLDWCLAKYWNGPITEVKNRSELERARKVGPAGAWVLPAEESLPVESGGGARRLAIGELGGRDYVILARENRP
ncbi:MAG: ArnT family glycosyltransferase [Thermoanaerobaculia bacterium]